MGILRRIFSKPEDASTIIQGARDGIDALIFTDQERTTMGIEAFKLWIEWQKATSAQNIARRYIAVIVVCLWTFLTVILTALAIADAVFAWESDPQAMILEVLMEMRVTEITLLIMGFYFAKHILTSSLQARNGK